MSELIKKAEFKCKSMNKKSKFVAKLLNYRKLSKDILTFLELDYNFGYGPFRDNAP